MTLRFWPSLGLTLLLACGPQIAQAAVFCVASAAELRAALATAATNGAADAVRLRTGTYVKRLPGMPVGETSVPFQHFGTETLSLSGGWYGPNGSCTQQYDDPALTVLDGDYDGIVLAINVSGLASVTVSNLSVTHGGFGGLFPEDSSSAITLSISEAANGAIKLSQMRIVNSLGRAFQSAVGLNAVISSGSLDLQNNLFLGNAQIHQTEGAGGAAIRIQSGIVRINNNSFIDNATSSPYTGSSGRAAGALHITRGGGQVHLANNLFENNQVDVFGTPQEHGLSLRSLVAAAGFSLLNNHLGRVAPSYPASVLAANSGNGVGDPMLAASGMPLLGSPLVDSGLSAPAGGTGTHDLIGQPRNAGGGVDRGALELLPALLSDGFESP